MYFCYHYALNPLVLLTQLCTWPSGSCLCSLMDRHIIIKSLVYKSRIFKRSGRIGILKRKKSKERRGKGKRKEETKRKEKRREEKGKRILRWYRSVFINLPVSKPSRKHSITAPSKCIFSQGQVVGRLKKKPVKW